MNKKIKNKSASNFNLWVGIVDVVPRSYSWLFKKRRIEKEISPSIVFPLEDKVKNWEWKLKTGSATATTLLIRNK